MIQDLKFYVGFKSLLRQELSESVFYGDLVYKLKKIVGTYNFSAQFIKIISHFKKNATDCMRGMVATHMTIDSYAFLFNCTPEGQT